MLLPSYPNVTLLRHFLYLQVFRYLRRIDINLLFSHSVKTNGFNFCEQRNCCIGVYHENIGLYDLGIYNSCPIHLVFFLHFFRRKIIFWNVLVIYHKKSNKVLWAIDFFVHVMRRWQNLAMKDLLSWYLAFLTDHSSLIN